MANSLVLAKNYTALLDEVYQMASVTAGLTSAPEMARAGANVNEIIYPQVEVTGLGDYSRSGGYTDGGVSLEWKTSTFNYDRGTKIMVDTMDDQETFNIAFGRAGAELMRTRVAPEADAFTFSTLAGIDGIHTKSITYEDAEEFLADLIIAKNVLDESEVPESERILFATPTLMNSLMALDSYKSKEAINWFSSKTIVPQSRFYTAIDLLDGKTSGSEAGHFAKADDASDINFMIIHKPALIKFDKHIANDLISPSANQTHDAYMLKYRKYGLVDVFKNKVGGIYMSYKASSSSGSGGSGNTGGSGSTGGTDDNSNNGGA